MALLCPAPGPDIGLVRALMGTVDCNVAGLTREGYGLLSRPDSAVMMILTSLMTLYVAFIGYRMVLGRSPMKVGDFTLSALKIGFVIALASNWAVYQTVVYDTLFKAPEQLATMMMSAVQPQGSAFRGDPFDGLQVAFDELTRSAGSFAGRAGAAAASPFVGGTGFAAFALNSSGFLMLVSSLGVVLASKIVLAVLLALAPLVAAMLLFDATRGVVEGWLKAAIAFSVAPFLATLFLALQLTMMEPTLVELARMRSEGRIDLGPATGALVMMLVFVAVLAGAGVCAFMIAAGVRLPRREAAPAAGLAAAAANAPTLAASQQPLPRAAAIAAAAAALERRETGSARASLSSFSERRITVGGERAGPGPSSTVSTANRQQPLGQSYRRAAAPRRSAAATRRDR